MAWLEVSHSTGRLDVFLTLRDFSLVVECYFGENLNIGLLFGAR